MKATVLTSGNTGQHVHVMAIGQIGQHSDRIAVERLGKALGLHGETGSTGFR
jgi:hypothetical protein